MSDISVQESKHDANALVLTISKQSFGEFIRDLISEKKRIGRDIKGTFVITRDEFLDLITLVNQRVNLQNQVLLATATLATRYRDGYQQEFQSLEEFNSSRDARQSEVCGARCVLTYVIKFPGREKPEKQEVSIEIRNIRAFEEGVIDKDSFSLSFRFLALGAQETGAAHIMLEYTEISWGYDLENLISQYLMQKFSRQGLVYSHIRFFGMLIVGFMTIMGAMLYSGVVYNRYIQVNKAAAAAAIDSNSTISSADKMLKKIDLAITSAHVTLTTEQWHSLLIQVAGFILVGAAVVLMLAIRRQSFLIMNEYTKLLYARYLKNYDYVRYALITSFAVGLFASLGASFLYNAITH